MNEKITKEYLRKTIKLLETKGINNWAGTVVRYLEPFLKWIKKELRQMDQRTRKLMTMFKTLHPKDDKQTACVKKRRGLANIEDCVYTSI